VSPELLLNDGRFEGLWGKKKFTNNIINLVLNEAHVIKEWGGTFRSDYLKIGPIQYLFPRMIPIHLGSATLGPATVPELAKNLHLRPDSTTICRLNTDRPNIFLIVQQMKYPANSYEDLAFLITKNMQPGDPNSLSFSTLGQRHRLEQSIYGLDYVQSYETRSNGSTRE
jgi:superfamily II DNA helicase RecQ